MIKASKDEAPPSSTPNTQNDNEEELLNPMEDVITSI
jgi:hypothetical protein